MQRGVDLKLEYFNGEIYALSGGSVGHNRISRNVLSFLNAALAGSSCEAFGSVMRVSTPSGLYTHPDASIVCGQKLPDAAETITDPVVLIEFLSDSARNYDRGQKFELYRSIPTLRHYLVIEQSSIQVEHHYRDDQGTWSQKAAAPCVVLQLVERRIELPLARIYDGIDITSTS